MSTTLGEAPSSAPAPPPSVTPPTVHFRHGVRRRWVWLGSILFTFLVIAYAVVSVIGASVATTGAHEALQVSASSIGSTYSDVSFPSRVDQLTLRGWLFRASPSNGRNVIMVHGFNNNRVNMGYRADLVAHDLIQHGYDVLLFDMRSAGTSDGDHFTLGNLEQRDLLGAYDFMRARGYAPSHMTVLGVSLGASTEILAASQMRDVSAMIADSAFADLRPVLEDRITKQSPLPRFFDWGIITAGQLFFNINPDLRPVDSVRALPGRAFLFVQASRDDWFPASNARDLYAASSNPQSKLVIVDTTGHARTYQADPTAYMQMVYAFIDQQMAAHGG